MCKKLVNIHGGKLRPLFIFIHLGLSIVSAYLSQTSFDNSAIIQLSISFASNLSYILSALSNPGYIVHKPIKKKQATSLGLKHSSNISEQQEDRVEALESGNSDFPEEKYRNIPESPHIIHEDAFSESIKSERIQSRHSYDYKGSLTSSPKSRILKIERLSAPKFEAKYDDTEEYMPRFCLACNIDQPVRAKHCRVCSKCVYRWDHHCTWLGNCIGEKNYLNYIIYLNLQSAELLSTIYFLISNLNYSPCLGFSITLLVLLSPTCLFSLFLTTFHYYLILRNRTMVECISWRKIYYLTGKSISPFDFGILNNLLLFCSVPKIRDWNQIFKNFRVINK